MLVEAHTVELEYVGFAPGKYNCFVNPSHNSTYIIMVGIKVFYVKSNC